jgi:hypothetical protein
MTAEASPALYRLVADQSKLDDRVSEVCKEQQTSDDALRDAIDRKNLDGKNIALARIKRNATKHAYEKFRKEPPRFMTGGPSFKILGVLCAWYEHTSLSLTSS